VPYDFWAIEFGYTGGDTKEILKRVAEPELVYATDEDTSGPDPLARRYDMAANSIDYANAQMELAKYHRGRLLEKFVQGRAELVPRPQGIQHHARVADAFALHDRPLGRRDVRQPRSQGRSQRALAHPGRRAAQQRAGLKWCIDNAFYDEAFGLTPEMLDKMTVDKWSDEGGWQDTMADAPFPVHDQIAGDPVLDAHDAPQSFDAAPRL
jgi:hypothetical protein